ncbi:MAG TPA: PilZ domain-containing protein [Allosphingosinicella sp.]|nr:PilZ domain-containing protein [Allosphingosinicella sp.]
MHEIRSSILLGDRGPAARRRRKGAGGLDSVAIPRQEARRADHRSEDRHDLVERSTILFRRRRLAVRVVNVSSRGAMIEAAIMPRIGEEIFILFSAESRTRCAVRWIRDGRIGLEFVGEAIVWENAPEGPIFHALPMPAEAGASERAPLAKSGTLCWSGLSVPVRLRGVSGAPALGPGAEVELDLGEGGCHRARIGWSADGRIGLRFAAALDLDSLVPAAPDPGEAAPALLRAADEAERHPDSPWAARFERFSTDEAD